MNFLRALGQTIDGLWALLTIPALIIGGIWGINYLPIPTFLFMLFLSYSQFQKAENAKIIYNISEDSDFKYSHFKYYTSGIIILLSTILVYAVFIWFALTKTNVLCYNTQGMIPGTLPEILQWILGKQCK